MLVKRAQVRGDTEGLQGIIDGLGDTSTMPQEWGGAAPPSRGDVGDERLMHRLQALQRTNESLTQQVCLFAR